MSDTTRTCLELAKVYSVADRGTRSLELGLSIPPPPEFQILVIGSRRIGKTEAIRLLLGEEVWSKLPQVDRKILPEYPYPVCYHYAPKSTWLFRVEHQATRQTEWRKNIPKSNGFFDEYKILEVRASLPSKILRDMDALIWEVDTEIIDHSMFLQMSDTPCLYLVPSRGVGEEDLEALEKLRRQGGAIAVIRWLYKKELNATRSVLKLDDFPDYALPFTFPIVPFLEKSDSRKYDEKSRDLMWKAIECLWCRKLNQSAWVDDVFDETKSLRTQVEAVAKNKFTAWMEKTTSLAEVGRTKENSAIQELDSLMALAELLQMGGMTRSSQIVAGDLDFLSSLIAKTRRDQRYLPDDARELAEQIAHEYNIEAAITYHEMDNAENLYLPEYKVGGEMVVFLKKIHSMLNALLKNKEQLELLEEEATQLSRLKEMSSSNQVDIALLGAFSSGKSSLINALLEHEVNDNGSTLLPTSDNPETATVNCLQWSRVLGIVKDGVKWQDSVILQLLSDNTLQRDRLRVRWQEIRSLGEWIKNGDVNPKDCDVDYLYVERGLVKREKKNELKTKYLRRLLDACDRGKVHFLYTDSEDPSDVIPDGIYPERVRIRRFQTTPETFASQSGSLDFLDQLKTRPDLALRVDHLEIGVPHDLLKYVRFIDTPGTDAPIPHHKKITHSLVRDKSGPVIYCFSGTTPLGNADRENLNLIRKIGLSFNHARRIFFVITQRDRVSDSDSVEILNHVRDQLKNLGFTKPRIYFTQVVNGKNEDFHTFVKEIGRFVTEDRRNILLDWVSSAEVILKGVQQRIDNDLQGLKSEQSVRDARVITINAEKRELLGLAEIFMSFNGDGVESVYAKFQKILERQKTEICDEINCLSGREEFKSFEERAEDLCKDASKELLRMVEKVSEDWGARISLCLIEYGSTRDSGIVRGALLDNREDLVQCAPLLSALEDCTWRSSLKRGWDYLCSFFSDTDYVADLPMNRSKLHRATETIFELAWELITDKLEIIHLQFMSQINLEIQSREHELRNLMSTSPHDKDIFSKRAELAGTWIVRFESLAELLRKAG